MAQNCAFVVQLGNGKDWAAIELLTAWNGYGFVSWNNLHKGYYDDR